jgi:hypothetical protein
MKRRVRLIAPSRQSLTHCATNRAPGKAWKESFLGVVPALALQLEVEKFVSRIYSLRNEIVSRQR